MIDTSESSQIARTSKRDEVTEDSVKKIIQTQMSRENKLKLANIVINNDNTLEDLKKNVEKIHKRIFDEIKK